MTQALSRLSKGQPRKRGDGAFATVTQITPDEVRMINVSFGEVPRLDLISVNEISQDATGENC